MYTNDKRLFSQILDVQVSNIPTIINGEEQHFTCEIASLDTHMLKVYVHNMHDLEVDKLMIQKSIYFGNKSLKSMVE